MSAERDVSPPGAVLNCEALTTSSLLSFSRCCPSQEASQPFLGQVRPFEAEFRAAARSWSDGVGRVPGRSRVVRAVRPDVGCYLAVEQEPEPPWRSVAQQRLTVGVCELSAVGRPGCAHAGRRGHPWSHASSHAAEYRKTASPQGCDSRSLLREARPSRWRPPWGARTTSRCPGVEAERHDDQQN